jgi:hypothetical protein
MVGKSVKHYSWVGYKNKGPANPQAGQPGLPTVCPSDRTRASLEPTPTSSGLRWNGETD